MASAQSSSGSVQSVDRALDLLELLAASDGEVGLSVLADQAGLVLPTAHRLMRTLINRGYARQATSRRYVLGPGLVHLGERAGRAIGLWMRPRLAELVDSIGETANVAMLDGDRVVYIAQVPSRHSMRMFTEVGRRVHPHSTGVGKALLAKLPDDRLRSLVQQAGMPAQTSRTCTDVDSLARELEQIRERGYAVDHGEQEIGVSCVAVAVPDPATMLAVSISGPDARVGPERIAAIVPLLRRVADRLARDLTYEESGP